jgi:signal transduction histidine kinase/ActR/RegA family two-component response regulator
MVSPSLYELVFNSSQHGNYLLSPDPQAIILAVNDAFLRASGRKREELLGISLFEAFPGNPDDPLDTGEAALRRSLALVVATGQPDTLPAVRYPIPVQLPNGEVVFEERFWNAVSTPVFGADGRILCISHTNFDITDKVRADNALRESEARYRALVSATADVIYRMSPDWTQLREMEGRGFLKDATGPSHIWLEDYIPEEDRGRVNAAIEEAIRTRSTFELEHQVRRLDGSYGWTLSRAVPMLDARGEIDEWVGAASDITERKQAEQALRQSDQRKDEFLAMLAHELRNPLAPISAAAQLLRMGRLDGAGLQHASQIIGRQVEHLTSLVDDLLDVSRVTRGTVELNAAPVAVHEIVGDAVEQVTPLVRARRHRLDLALAPQPGLVMGDKKRMVQVLTNLLNNAAKYTPEGGSLWVSTRVRGGAVEIEVADNGVGMSPDLVARAFELFVQAQRTSDRAQGGLGLGLPLVRSLVELHGGTVRCDSAGPGQGSRFTVCLPRLPGQASTDAPRHERIESPVGTRPLRVLVVDDNRDAAAMLAMVLEAGGHQVAVEHGAQQALARAHAGTPDVCLLDIGLPGMDGYELAARLRADPATAGAVLVAVTGYGQENDRARSARAGFDHHLVKPVDTGRLSALLAEVGTRASARR